MEEQIRKAVSGYLAKQGAGDVAFVVERPNVMSHGDYTTNAALAAYKQISPPAGGPRELADALAQHLMHVLGDTKVSHVSVAGPGFVNLTLSPEMIALSLAEAGAEGEAWGTGTLSSGKRVMVEYTDPNPFKEMHIGHLMSNTIGEALSRLIANEGATVIRACYSGDIGPHVAKAVWQLQRSGVTDPGSAQELSRAYVDGNTAYEESSEAKSEIDALNTALYEGADTALMELWRKGREIALGAFRKIFAILGTHFDYYFFESETSEPGTRVVRDGIAKGIFEESDGAVIYRGEKKGLHTLVFITSRGTPTYEAKDIGLAFLKEERVQTDRSIIMTGQEQVGHFKIVLAALHEIAPLVAAKTTHVAHGLLRLTTGKMASRKGNVITAAGFIEEIIGEAQKKNPDPIIAEQVAIGAIKYMVLRQSPGQDVIFDPVTSLSLEGDSGPYLQYALVRARKILAYAAGEGGTEKPASPFAVERLIVHYPEIAARAAAELSPNLLTAYLTELASAWNSFYASEQVLGSPDEAYKQRIVRAFVATMTNGLTLLGIPTPERM